MTSSWHHSLYSVWQSILQKVFRGQIQCEYEQCEYEQFLDVAKNIFYRIFFPFFP